MSWDFYKKTTPTASKKYPCDASIWFINSGLDDSELEPSDLEIVNRVRGDKYMIQPGEKYIKQVGKWEGDFSTFRANPDIDRICHKYDLYAD